jgi:hypothetical protein
MIHRERRLMKVGNAHRTNGEGCGQRGGLVGFLGKPTGDALLGEVVGMVGGLGTLCPMANSRRQRTAIEAVSTCVIRASEKHILVGAHAKHSLTELLNRDFILRDRTCREELSILSLPLGATCSLAATNVAGLTSCAYLMLRVLEVALA